MINKLFGGTIGLTSKALDLLSTRQNIIQSNIANIDTPGYKAVDLPFDQIIKSVINGQGELAKTNGKHIGAQQLTAADTGKPGQGNKPVDLDGEMLKLAENQLRYQVATKIITKKFEGLRYVIDEGGK